MKVLDIRSISKEEGYIYYINKYQGTAILDIMAQEVSIPVGFRIEMNPLGQKSIQIDPLPADLNYPVLPIKKSLLAFIDTMSKNGSLP